MATSILAIGIATIIVTIIAIAARPVFMTVDMLTVMLLLLMMMGASFAQAPLRVLDD